MSREFNFLLCFGFFLSRWTCLSYLGIDVSWVGEIYIKVLICNCC
jgi:hypothetical protein